MVITLTLISQAVLGSQISHVCLVSEEVILTAQTRVASMMLTAVTDKPILVFDGATPSRLRLYIASGARVIENCTTYSPIRSVSNISNGYLTFTLFERDLTIDALLCGFDKPLSSTRVLPGVCGEDLTRDCISHTLDLWFYYTELTVWHHPAVLDLL